MRRIFLFFDIKAAKKNLGGMRQKVLADSKKAMEPVSATFYS